MNKIYLSILFIVLLISPLGATNYYVDSILGDDSNNGLSIQHPWKSLEKVNNTEFLPGDSILFRKKGIWSGGLDIYSRGVSENPIVFSAYGTGEKPLIQGNGKVQAPIFIHNSASFVTINGFAVTNFDSLNVFDGAEDVRCGIQIGEWSGALKQVQILNNEVYFIEGCSNHSVVGSPRGTSLDPEYHNLYQNAGIFCHASSIDSLIISGNYVHDCTCTGIFAFQFETATNLLIRQNSVYNVGSDGIVILHAKDPLVELNACIKAGNNSGASPRGPDEIGSNGLAVAGIWSFGCSDPVFQYNYCEATKRITWDGQAWDFDLETTGKAVYQFNYSRDNEGGFNLGGMPNQVFRYNISYNDGAKQGNAQYFFNNSPMYYNNVFYRTDKKGFLFSEIHPQSFINNIFITNATTNINYQDEQHDFSNNCFYGHTPIKPGADPVLADPLFLEPTSLGKIPPGTFLTVEDLRKAVYGLQLKPGSPCINAGLEIPDYSGVDFWGNAVPKSRTDIGANEFASHQSSIHNQFVKESNISIYPNPAKDQFTIQMENDASLESVMVYNMVGNLLISSKGPIIGTSSLSRGLYIVKVSANHCQASKKLLIE